MTRYSSRPVPARGLPDRQVRRVARVAEGAPLLREYRVYSSIEGSNPSLSASSRQYPRSLSPVPVKTAGHGQGNDQGRWSRLTEQPVFRQNSASVSCAPVAQLDIAPGYEIGRAS